MHIRLIFQGTYRLAASGPAASSPGLEPSQASIRGTSDSRWTIPGSLRILPGSIRTLPGSFRDQTLKLFRRQVEQHASDNDAWIVVKDKVYDCTPFLEKHPGGSASITMNAGQDCTEDFTAVHSAKVCCCEEHILSIQNTF